MVGCVKDDISLYNNGQKDWEDIEILAGGKVHKIKRLNGWAKKNLLKALLEREVFSELV